MTGFHSGHGCRYSRGARSETNRDCVDVRVHRSRAVGIDCHRSTHRELASADLGLRESGSGDDVFDIRKAEGNPHANSATGRRHRSGYDLAVDFGSVLSRYLQVSCNRDSAIDDMG